MHPSFIGKLETGCISASSPGNGGELLPYGKTGLVFKDGNENTDLQEDYYAYLNRYVREHHIPGVYFEEDDSCLEKLDEITDILSNMMKEYVYIEKGTSVLGEIAESDFVNLFMDEPEVKKRK